MLACCFGATGTLHATNTDVSAMDNVIYIEPFSAPSNMSDFVVSLKMKNAATISAFQLDMVLPEGVTPATYPATGLIKCTLANGRLGEGDDHSISMSLQPDGCYRVLCTSNNNLTFTGSDGVIATLKVDIASSMAEGDYPIVITYQKLNGPAMSEFYEPGEIETTLTVTGPDDGRTILDETSEDVPEASDGAVNVRVLRTINANEWSTICLPFAMTAAQVTAAFGEDVQLADADSYETTEDDDDNIVNINISFSTVQSIQANHPYIIKVSSAITSFEVDEVVVTPATSVSGRRKRIGSGSYFIGNYENQTEVPEFGIFLNGNKFWYSLGDTKMKAFRSYFSLRDVLTEVDEAAARISFSFDDSEATGIAENERMRNGENEKRMYDLQGRRISASLNDKGKMINDKVQRGIYIVNGKKVVK